MCCGEGESDPDDKRDDFGRLLATVEVNGQDVGDVLRRRGLADRWVEDWAGAGRRH